MSSYDLFDDSGRNSFFIRVLLMFTTLLCRPSLTFPDQVNSKSFSHSLAQVRAQVKVRFPPGPADSAVTVKTENMTDETSDLFACLYL